MSCLDATAVQAYVGGTLAADERAAAEAHLDTCEDCRRLVAALVATNAGAPTEPGSAPTIDASPHALRRGDDPELGEAIDRYRLTKFLGAGGMGIVYAAHDPELRRDVALKLLHPGREAGPGVDLQARLVREAQAMAQVAHPNVIAVYDVGTWRGEVFLAMELATGGTLRAWCKQAKRSPRQIVDAFAAAGRGLAAAHAVGLVHRDFKPDNVLVGADGRVRVTDFGLARSRDAPASAPPASRDTPPPRPSQPLATLTATGAVMGTPGYMASEIYAGQPADARTDQFAFCVALWEALYGKRPFAGKTEAELAEAVAADRIADPPAGRAVPRAIERALRRGLAADPDARWPTMDALLAELEPPARRTWLYASAAVVVVLAGGAALAAAAWPRASRIAHAPSDAAIDAIDPAAAQAEHEIEDRFARAGTELAAGHTARANELVADAVAVARASGSEVILMSTLENASRNRDLADDLPTAERWVREARRIAEARHDDPAKASLALLLAQVLDKEGKSDEADDVRKLSSATASHADAGNTARASALEAEANASASVDQAIAKWNEALALRDPADVIGWSQNRNGLASTLFANGRVADAIEVARATEQAIEQSTAQPLYIAYASRRTLELLALLETQAEKFDAAIEHARGAIAIEDRKLKDDPATGIAEMTLGTALLGKGEGSAAEAAFARVFEIQKDHPLELGSTHQVIAVMASRRNDLPRAIQHIAESIALFEQVVGPNNALTLRAKLLECKFLLRDHQRERARPIAEAILPKIETAHMDAIDIGDARLSLARALPASEHARAVKLAESAREPFAHAGSKGAERAKFLDRWLADPEAQPETK